MNAYRFAPNAQAWVDPLGLCNCGALERFVNYVRTHGKIGAVTGQYHPLNNKNLIPLNDPCESIYGEIDIDWMLRVSYSSLSKGDFGAWLDYRVAKFYWNVIRSFSDEYQLEFDSIMHGRFLTAQDIDSFLRDLPAVQYFDDKQNVIVGNSTEDAAAKVRARLTALNE